MRYNISAINIGKLLKRRIEIKYELASEEDFNYSLLRKKDIHEILITDEVAPKGVELTDLSNFDTSNVKDMSRMFEDCDRLEKIVCRME